MGQSKILLDSNSYFRLAKDIHPLLDTIFGTENYCLYVLKELDDEFYRSHRLRTEFAWVESNEYYSNRQKRLTVSHKDKRAINLAADFINRHGIDQGLGVSRVDSLCLAYGHVLSIPVVTDDMDMLQVGSDLAVQTMKTLELLRLMLDSGHIDKAGVRRIASYWNYIRDKPGNFRTDFIRIFGERPP